MSGLIQHNDHRVIEAFLASYDRLQDYYRRAAELCHEVCTHALTSSGIRHISTFRSKGKLRLREKLYQRLQENSERYTGEEDIVNDIVDLSGVRVALYFPGQRPEAVRVLTDVLDVRKAYKFPEDKKESRRGADVYTYSFGGYSATHLHVKLKSAVADEDMTKYLAAQIEIQVASVFTHAWAEVEHDLVYKPIQGELSIGEYAWLDQVNGLTVAGNCALEQLQRTMQERIAEAGRNFENHYDLASYLHSKLADRISDVRMGRADKLWMFLAELKLHRPSQLQPLLESFALTSQQTVVEGVVQMLIQTEPSQSSRRMAIWRAVEAATADNPYGSDDPLLAELKCQQRLRKEWSAFDDAAWQIIKNSSDSPSHTQHAWMDPAALRELKFTEQTVSALIAAHRAYLLVEAGRWTGTTEQLEEHNRALEAGVAHLYSKFSPVLTQSWRSR